MGNKNLNPLLKQIKDKKLVGNGLYTATLLAPVVGTGAYFVKKDNYLRNGNNRLKQQYVEMLLNNQQEREKRYKIILRSLYVTYTEDLQEYEDSRQNDDSTSMCRKQMLESKKAYLTFKNAHDTNNVEVLVTLILKYTDHLPTHLHPQKYELSKGEKLKAAALGLGIGSLSVPAGMLTYKAWKKGW